LGLKITATVSWFGPQNQPGFGLSVAPQNQQREDGVGHTSRSGEKQVVLGFPNLASRLVEAQQRVVHMAPSQSLRQNQVEDGRVKAMGYIGPATLTLSFSMY
jgi:hypothetical protein